MAGGSSSRPPSAQTGPAQVGGLPPLSRLSLDAGRGEAGSAFPVRADVFLGSSEAPEHASAPELPSSDGRGLGLPGPAPQTRTAERDAPAFTAFRQPPSICGASSECDSDCSCSTGSSVYEMPSDVLGLRDASAGSLDAGGCCGCCCIGEAKLDQELQELEDKVTSLGAEMVVQSAELAMADKRFAQIAEALQCSICLDTLGHPHSLACGHAFCQECLLQWLAHSKKCPTCRAPVTQRPAVAFAVQDIIRCVKLPTSGHEQPPAGAQSGPDPWALLFPPSTTVAASAAATVHTPLPNFVICTVCSRNMLEGEACVNCAIDALHRSITE
ncbi:E3 ubiquitin ligase, partial [Coemansia spiralis]